ASLEKPLAVLPGFLGITLGDNPNGVVPDLARRFQPLRQVPAVMVGQAIVLVGLFVARGTGALRNWPFAIFAFLVVFAGPSIAELIVARRARVAPDPDHRTVPLEWVGIERPFTADDVDELDRELALPQLG